MTPSSLRTTIYIGGGILVCVGILLYVLLYGASPEITITPQVTEEEAPQVQQEVIGTSVEGRALEAYTFGDGATQLLFVGGMHGGYEWNSVFLAYRLIDYLSANPNVIPDTLTVSVIPSANPDGLHTITGTDGRFSVDDVPDTANATGEGRFNANGVDLNRNFDCKWQSESTWKGNIVSAGGAPFSEPEAKAIRNFILQREPSAVVFWHSKGGAVYASECENGILPKTLDIMHAYATGSGYLPIETFDAYPITGDAEGYLAKIGIPAVTVELSTYMTIEWEKNLAGIQALFEYLK